MPLGRIAKFFEDRGYGFIQPDAGQPERVLQHERGNPVAVGLDGVRGGTG